MLLLATLAAATPIANTIPPAAPMTPVTPLNYAQKLALLVDDLILWDSQFRDFAGFDPSKPGGVPANVAPFAYWKNPLDQSQGTDYAGDVAYDPVRLVVFLRSVGKATDLNYQKVEGFAVNSCNESILFLMRELSTIPDGVPDSAFTGTLAKLDVALSNINNSFGATKLLKGVNTGPDLLALNPSHRSLLQRASKVYRKYFTAVVNLATAINSRVGTETFGSTLQNPMVVWNKIDEMFAQIEPAKSSKLWIIAPAVGVPGLLFVSFLVIRRRMLNSKRN
jgi:hypothetical protein